MPAAVASEAPMGENTAPSGIKGVASLTSGAAEKVVKREAQDDEVGNGGSGEKRHEDGGHDDDYRGNAGSHHGALWARSTKNPNVSTGPLACPFAWSLAPMAIHSVFFSILDHSVAIAVSKPKREGADGSEKRSAWRKWRKTKWQKGLKTWAGDPR